MQSLDTIVRVTIDRLTKLPTKQGFGTPLILDINSVQTNKVDTFTSLEGMLDAGFSTTDEAYKAAQALMSQSPTVERFKVGKRAANVAQVVTFTPTVVNDFNYQVTINGTVHSYMSDSDATDLEIVAGLLAAINGGAQAANVTATGTTTLIVTSDVAGQGFSYVAGTNLSAVLTTANVGPATELDAVIDEDDDFYFLLCTDRSELAIFQLAAAIETKVKMYAFETDDANSRDLAPASDTTSIFARLKTLGYDRTFGIYIKTANLGQYPASAWVGRVAPVDLDLATATWKFKRLVGVAASDELTTTQLTNILRSDSGPSKNGNVYVTVGGQGITQEGSVFSGEFIDIIHGTDWLAARIRENVYFLLINEQKVPFDNGGIQSVVLRVEQKLEQAVRTGLLRGGDDKPVVTAPDINDIPQADRGNRFLSGIEFEGFYAGAVHKVAVQGRITV